MDEGPSLAQVIAKQLRRLMGVLIGPTNLAGTSRTSKSQDDITLYSLIEHPSRCTEWFIWSAESVLEEPGRWIILSQSEQIALLWIVIANFNITRNEYCFYYSI